MCCLFKGCKGIFWQRETIVESSAVSALARRIIVAFPGSSKVFKRALAATSGMVSACSKTTTFRGAMRGDRLKNSVTSRTCSKRIMGELLPLNPVAAASAIDILFP